MDKKSLYLVIGVVIVAFSWVAFEINSRTTVDFSVSDAKNNPSAKKSSSLTELTQQLLAVAHELRKASPEQHDPLLEQLITLAKSRQSQMKAVAFNDPDSVVKNTIPGVVKKQLPEDVREFIEEPAELSGELDVVIIEDDADNVSYDYTLNSGGKITKLNMGGYRKDLVSGQKVRVKGTLISGEMSVATDSSSVQITSNVAPDVIATKRIAAILFNYTSNTSQPYNAATVREGLFGTGSSVKNYYLEASFGKMDSTGDVFDYVTVNASPTSCDYYGLSGLANTAAASQRGFNINNYDNVMYFFPQPPGCGGYWLGQVGGKSSWHMLNDSAFLRHSAHELAHNYGRHHANSYNCGGVTLGASCSTTEYGDPYSIMGVGGVVKHFTAFHKAMPNYGPQYLSASNMRTVSSSGEYTLEHIAAPTTGTQLLRIPRGSTGQYIYFTFRQPFGFDNFGAGSSITTGVSMHLAGDYSSTAQSQLLDASPDGNFNESTLKVGQTFTDSTYGSTVQVVSISEAGAVLNINVAPTPCSKSNPTLSISPSSITTEAGQTVSYNLTLKNNDGNSCPTSTYNVLPTLAAGLSQTPASFSETLTPGSSVTRTFMITTDPLITSGSKSISQRSTDTGSTSYSATANASLVIPTPVGQSETIPPTVTITAPANGSRVDANTTVSVSASDNSGIGSINIQIDGTTVKTCSGATSCMYKWNTRKAANGTHTIKAIAVDKAAAPNKAETSITVTK